MVREPTRMPHATLVSVKRHYGPWRALVCVILSAVSCVNACVGRQVRKSVKPVEQGLVQMVNKTDKHKHWLATRPTSLTTDMTQEAGRTRTLLAQRSRACGSRGAERGRVR